jgi:hypothetical protein
MDWEQNICTVVAFVLTVPTDKTPPAMSSDRTGVEPATESDRKNETTLVFLLMIDSLTG